MSLIPSLAAFWVVRLLLPRCLSIEEMEIVAIGGNSETWSKEAEKTRGRIWEDQK